MLLSFGLRRNYNIESALVDSKKSKGTLIFCYFVRSSYQFLINCKTKKSSTHGCDSHTELQATHTAHEIPGVFISSISVTALLLFSKEETEASILSKMNQQNLKQDCIICQPFGNYLVLSWFPKLYVLRYGRVSETNYDRNQVLFVQ